MGEARRDLDFADKSLGAESSRPSPGLYYVLPYVEGESLRAKLAREGGLPITDAGRVLRDHPRFQALLAKYEN